MRLVLLIKKGFLKHKGSLFGIFLLFFIISLSLVLAINISVNSNRYITSQMERLGFGNMTVWIQQNNQLDQLTQDLREIQNVEDVRSQLLIYAGYSIHGSRSDNEGQLLAYHQEAYDYQFLDENLAPVSNQMKIESNEIYVSPAMHSTYQFHIGDQIEFDISRSSSPKVFTIKGYFEDPFMGSSMIDMKSFLINDEVFTSLTEEIQQTSDFNKLARTGAMMHIFQNKESSLTINEFNQQVNQNSLLSHSTEFVYTQSAIYGFMMILQNMLSGFLATFVMVLLLVSMIVIGYNITHALELERKDMGILKTIGFTSRDIRLSQMMQYGVSMIAGMLASLLVSVLVADYLSLAMVTSTGIRIPSDIPYCICFAALLMILFIMILFILIKTRKIIYIAPVLTIQKSHSQLSSSQMKLTKINHKHFIFNLSKRQLLSGKKRYIGTFVISILLVFFLSAVGKINHWIGPRGEGLMNAFSVAAHDLGVQPMTNINMDDIEDMISSYTSIEHVYELAMENVLVDGVDYTANIINDPTYFHIIRGHTSRLSDDIVITESVASDLGVDIGDHVNIIHDSKSADYKVVGIYQCANEMGANIGMSVAGYERIAQIDTYIWCRHYLLSDHSMNNTIMTELQQNFPLDIAVHTNSWSGLDGIVSTMNLLTIGMYVLVMIFILIIIILTGSKMLYSEQSDMAIFKSIGLTSKQLRVSFTLRFTIIVLAGGIVGTMLSILFSDILITYLVTMFGIGEFHSQLNLMNIILPILITTSLFSIFAYLTSYRIKKVALTELIKGD